MTHILSILRAAHCRSTHHYFALDALQNLKTAQAQRLANILLKYHDDYLVGAKAPDCNFKDFQNHVIHVSDNNWGGAAQKCQEWLSQARQYLDEGKWKKAAYACGVLSHYFTDPIMPLHTAQHPREQVVHRPMEWSICQSYQEIFGLCCQLGCESEFVLSVDDQWISKAVRAAAAVAHRHYDRLIAIYDVDRGVAKPREGLNDEAMSILAELFSLAIGGWSRVLTRLADETTKELPQVSLSLTSLLATIDMPLAWIVRRISDMQERRAVQAVFKEYKKTGSLKRHLPAEIAVVRDSKIANPNLGQQLDSPPATSDGAKFDQAILHNNQSTELRTNPTMDQTKSESDIGPSVLKQPEMLASRLADVELPGEPSLTAMEPEVHVPAPAELSAELTLTELAVEVPTLEQPITVQPVYSVEVADQFAAEVAREVDADRLAAMVAPQTNSPGSADSIRATTSPTTESIPDSDSELPQFVSLSQARGRMHIHPIDPATIQAAKSEHSTTQRSEDDTLSTIAEYQLQEAQSHDDAAANSFLQPIIGRKLRIAPGTTLPIADDQQNTTHYGSPLVDAPSIGPKTAKRFENIGISTIRQLISTSPETIVRGLATRWITESLVQDWQDQARLVCEVPALSGYRAQLLVAIGCRTSWQLRTGNAASLHLQISQFCQTSEGQQILRSARLPDVEDVVRWIDSARTFARRDVA